MIRLHFGILLVYSSANRNLLFLHIANGVVDSISAFGTSYYAFFFDIVTYSYFVSFKLPIINGLQLAHLDPLA